MMFVITGVWLFEGGRIALSATAGQRSSAGAGPRTPQPAPIQPAGDAPEHLPMDRVGHRGELSELFSRARAARRDGAPAYLWVDIVEPTQAEMAMVGDVFGLPSLQLEDALSARQRPKVERAQPDAFLVLKSLTYIEATSDIETHQVSAFAGPGYLVTIAHDRYDLAAAVLARFAREPRLRKQGASGGLYALLDVVVDEYLAVAAEIARDIEEIEERVFSPERTDDAAAIYRLKRENLELRRAVGPLSAIAGQVTRGLVPEIGDRMEAYYRDVADHLIRAVEYGDNYDQLLMTMLMASTARQDLQQNADMRRISAYVALAAVPTLIAGVYGMNFAYMPELDEVWGYPFAIALMGAICLGLYRLFKRSGWL